MPKIKVPETGQQALDLLNSTDLERKLSQMSSGARVELDVRIGRLGTNLRKIKDLDAALSFHLQKEVKGVLFFLGQ